MKTTLLITSDTGSGTRSQTKVSDAMYEKSKTLRIPPEAMCFLGDNIYESGVISVSDPQFKDKFEIPYKRFDIPIYLCLGNHDYGNSHFDDGRWKHEIEYTKHSRKWKMPSRYYHKQFGPCDFFFLDTNLDMMSQEDILTQLSDVKDMIRKSTQPWKILCGHHTWRSVGGHGNAEKDVEAFLTELMSERDYSIDAYLCGHDHCKNHHQVTLPCKRKVDTIVIGTGGKNYDPNMKYFDNLVDDTYMHFHSPNLGYLTWEASPTKIRIVFYDENNRREHRHMLRKHKNKHKNKHKKKTQST